MARGALIEPRAWRRPCRLEHQFQRQLQDAGIAGRRNASERGRGQARTRAVEVHIIERIEEFRAELGVNALVIFVFLMRPRSVLNTPGARKMPLPSLPKVP